MIIITSKSYKRYLSLFFYRNFYFFINILFFFIKNNTVYRRSITINKIHPFLTQWKPYLTKRQGPGVSQLILGNSEPLDDSKARSKGQKKPERPFLWHVERTKMAGHFFHAKGARFANGSTINGALEKTSKTIRVRETRDKRLIFDGVRHITIVPSMGLALQAFMALQPDSDLFALGLDACLVRGS